MNQVPAFERVQYTDKEGNLTPGVNNNLQQLYATLRGYAQLINVTASPQIISPSIKYYDNFLGTTVFTLPTVAQFGDFFAIIGGPSGGWSLHQSALQQIQYGTLFTTVGITGSLNAAAIGSCAFLICTNPNLGFSVESFVGTLTVT
jgi:hypothetical protein